MTHNLSSRKLIHRSLALFVCLSFISHDLFAFSALNVASPQSIPTNTISFSSDVAKIDDSVILKNSQQTIYLIQDAHTNPSCQFNVAKILGSLAVSEKDLKSIYVEASDANVSISELRKLNDQRDLSRIAKKLVLEGRLNGVEYMDVTTDHPYRIQGVEDMGLYDESLANYKKVLHLRGDASTVLDRLESDANRLKSSVYNPFLMEADNKKDDYQKGKLLFADYLSYLLAQASVFRVPESDSLPLQQLASLKQIEAGLDFQKAAYEHGRFVESLSKEEIEGLSATRLSADSMKFSFSSMEGKKAYFLQLESKLKTQDTASYEHLYKYIAYVKAIDRVDFAKAWEDFESLEGSLMDIMASSDQEKTLYQTIRHLGLMRHLIYMSLTPMEFKQVLAGSDNLSIANIIADINALADQGGKNTYDSKNSLQDASQAALKFYLLTYLRDLAFAQNMAAQMSANSETKAVLYTGGYHTANLKKILSDRGISYVSITPNLVGETNKARYEAIMEATKLDVPNTTQSTQMPRWQGDVNFSAFPAGSLRIPVSVNPPVLAGARFAAGNTRVNAENILGSVVVFLKSDEAKQILSADEKQALLDRATQLETRLGSTTADIIEDTLYQEVKTLAEDIFAKSHVITSWDVLQEHLKSVTTIETLPVASNGLVVARHYQWLIPADGGKNFRIDLYASHKPGVPDSANASVVTAIVLPADEQEAELSYTSTLIGVPSDQLEAFFTAWDEQVAKAGARMVAMEDASRFANLVKQSISNNIINFLNDPSHEISIPFGEIPQMLVGRVMQNSIPYDQGVFTYRMDANKVYIRPQAGVTPVSGLYVLNQFLNETDSLPRKALLTPYADYYRAVSLAILLRRSSPERVIFTGVTADTVAYIVRPDGGEPFIVSLYIGAQVDEKNISKSRHIVSSEIFRNLVPDAFQSNAYLVRSSDKLTGESFNSYTDQGILRNGFPVGPSKFARIQVLGLDFTSPDQVFVTDFSGFGKPDELPILGNLIPAIRHDEASVVQRGVAEFLSIVIQNYSEFGPREGLKEAIKNELETLHNQGIGRYFTDTGSSVTSFEAIASIVVFLFPDLLPLIKPLLNAETEDYFDSIETNVITTQSQDEIGLSDFLSQASLGSLTASNTSHGFVLTKQLDGQTVFLPVFLGVYANETHGEAKARVHVKGIRELPIWAPTYNTVRASNLLTGQTYANIHSISTLREDIVFGVPVASDFVTHSEILGSQFIVYVETNPRPSVPPVETQTATGARFAKLRKPRITPDLSPRPVEVNIPTRSISGLLDTIHGTVQDVDKTKLRKTKDVRELLAGGAWQIIGSLRGADIWGSSIDLDELQELLSEDGDILFEQIASTFVLASNISTTLELSPASRSEWIEYEVVEHETDPNDTTKLIRKVTLLTYRVDAGVLKKRIVTPGGAVRWRDVVQKDGTTLDGQWDAFAYILHQFNLTGVKGSVSLDNPIANTGGFGRSGALNELFFKAGNLLSNAQLSKADIFAEATTLENLVFNGYTGGQEALATEEGYGVEAKWIGQVKDRSGQRIYPKYSYLAFRPFADVKALREFAKHVFFIQPGITYQDGKLPFKRTASLVNEMWMSLARYKHPEGLKLHKEKKELAAIAAYGLQNGKIEYITYALNRHKEIRDRLQQIWFELALSVPGDAIDQAYPIATEFRRLLQDDTYFPARQGNSKWSKGDLIELRKFYAAHQRGELDLRKTSLYSITANPFIAKLESQGFKTLAAFLPGAGGYATNLMVVVGDEDLPKFRAFLRKEGIKRFTRQNAPETMATMKGTGEVKGYFNLVLGHPVRYKGVPKHILKESTSKKSPTGYYDPNTGNIVLDKPVQTLSKISRVVQPSAGARFANSVLEASVEKAITRRPRFGAGYSDPRREENSLSARRSGPSNPDASVPDARTNPTRPAQPGVIATSAANVNAQARDAFQALVSQWQATKNALAEIHTSNPLAELATPVAIEVSLDVYADILQAIRAESNTERQALLQRQLAAEIRALLSQMSYFARQHPGIQFNLSADSQTRESLGRFVAQFLDESSLGAFVYLNQKSLDASAVVKLVSSKVSPDEVAQDASTFYLSLRNAQPATRSDEVRTINWLVQFELARAVPAVYQLSIEDGRVVGRGGFNEQSMTRLLGVVQARVNLGRVSSEPVVSLDNKTLSNLLTGADFKLFEELAMPFAVVPIPINVILASAKMAIRAAGAAA